MVICDYSKVTKLFHFSLADNIGAYILMNYYFCFKFFFNVAGYGTALPISN